MLHAFIVGFDSLTEIVGAIFVKELRDDGDELVSLGETIAQAHLFTASTFHLQTSGDLG